MADGTIGTAYLAIQPTAKGIRGSITKMVDPEAKSAGESAGRTTASSLSSTLKKVGGNMMKAGAVASAIAVPLVAGIKNVLSAYETQIVAETKLDEIYRSRLHATAEMAQATKNLASSIQQYGIVGDEVLISGAQQLATFMTSSKSVDALLPAMANLVVQQKGYNATAEDAVNVANLMGKVMNGQTGALRRVGISFDENQEKVLKYGTEEERVAMLAEVIDQNVGQMNEAMANTPLGQIQQATNRWGDMKEQIGGALAPVLASVAEVLMEKVAPAIQKAVDYFSKHTGIAKFVVAITGVLAVGGPLLIMLGAIVTSIGALIPVVTAVSAPMLGIVAVITAVVAGLILAYKNSETFRKAVNTLGSALKTYLVGSFNLLKPILSAIWTLISKLASILGAILAPVVTKVATVIKTVGTVFSAMGTAVSGAVAKFKSSVGTMASPVTTAYNTISGVIKKIKGLFPLSVGKLFSNLKLPHFNVSGGKAPWGLGGKGKMPKISVQWYAQGGIVDGATLIGAGEAGPEAIVPLDPFWKKLDQMAVRGDTTINVYAPEGMDTVALAREVERRLIQSEKRRTQAWR